MTHSQLAVDQFDRRVCLNLVNQLLGACAAPAKQAGTDLDMANNLDPARRPALNANAAAARTYIQEDRLINRK
jgi:hypothetical protein